VKGKKLKTESWYSWNVEVAFQCFAAAVLGCSRDLTSVQSGKVGWHNEKRLKVVKRRWIVWIVNGSFSSFFPAFIASVGLILTFDILDITSLSLLQAVNPCGRGVVDNGNFQRFRWLFLQKLWRWGRRYYIAIRSLSSLFSVIPKCVTLNGYFTLNSVFAPVCLAVIVQLSKNNCVKTNKDRHTLSAAQISGGDSSFWRYKVCVHIHSDSLERRR